MCCIPLRLGQTGRTTNHPLQGRHRLLGRKTTGCGINRSRFVSNTKPLAKVSLSLLVRRARPRKACNHLSVLVRRARPRKVCNHMSVLVRRARPRRSCNHLSVLVKRARPRRSYNHLSVLVRKARFSEKGAERESAGCSCFCMRYSRRCMLVPGKVENIVVIVDLAGSTNVYTLEA